MPLLFLLALALVGCAHRAPQPPEPPRAQPPASEPSAVSTARVGSDLLPSDARFADLVHAADALESRASPAAGCLLEETPEGTHLRAELASAVRPLPAPPEDLDATLASATEIDILSVWGRHGTGGAPLALASFTATPPTRSALALLVTDRGLALRGPSGRGVVPRDALSTEALRGILASEPEATLFVAAEAGTPVRALYRTLEVIAQAGRPVALAVSLSPRTALPTAPAPRTPVARCASGLSTTEEPEGALPVSALTAGLAPLKQSAADCLTRGDARGAAGGRLSLALRVNASGRVQEACLAADELGDPGVASCVLDLARGLSFAPPSPRGVLDIELPMVLRPAPAPVQRPVCSPPAS